MTATVVANVVWQNGQSDGLGGQSSWVQHLGKFKCFGFRGMSWDDRIG